MLNIFAVARGRGLLGGQSKRAIRSGDNKSFSWGESPLDGKVPFGGSNKGKINHNTACTGKAHMNKLASQLLHACNMGSLKVDTIRLDWVRAEPTAVQGGPNEHIIVARNFQGAKNAKNANSPFETQLNF